MAAQDASAGFGNILPFLREPLPEFRDFEYFPWSKIFSEFRGSPQLKEAEFLASRIEQSHARNLVDFGVGAGFDLEGILSRLSERGWSLSHVAGIDNDGELLDQASLRFNDGGHSVSLHNADWLDLNSASPHLGCMFDFGLLTGNSLAHISTGIRDSTLQLISHLVSELARFLQPGGRLFIDTRNFDYIATLGSQTPVNRMTEFSRLRTTYYHGLGDSRFAFPAYISDTLVVFHYYDLISRIWSANDFFPLYQNEIVGILQTRFEIEETLYDFYDQRSDKSLFCQFVARVQE